MNREVGPNKVFIYKTIIFAEFQQLSIAINNLLFIIIKHNKSQTDLQ